MKHVIIYGAITVGLFLGVNEASAQFHNKEGESGQTVMNPQARANMFAQQMQAQVGRGEHQQSAHFLPAWANDPNLNGAIRLGEMGGRQSYVMGQTVHHSNGSYTETTREEKMTRDVTDIEQTTYSARGVKLAIRTIKHDEQGRPREVVIRDAEDKFKYRGILVYDDLSRRLKEEQLYDASNQLLRRNIQKYDDRGHRLPFETYDYVKDLPVDLQLVVTKEDKVKEPQEQRPRLFDKKKPEAETLSDSGVITGVVPEETEKKGILKRIFKKNR